MTPTLKWACPLQQIAQTPQSTPEQMNFIFDSDGIKTQRVPQGLLGETPSRITTSLETLTPHTGIVPKLVQLGCQDF